MDNPPRILVVTPTYDEASNIEEMLRRTRAAMPDADILVVDDASPDGTGAIAERLAAELDRIEVLHRPAKEGLGVAYRAGFALGMAKGYDVLVQMDADLSHDPEVIPNLCAAVASGADVAVGSRYVPGGSIPYWPWYRRALSKYGNWYACSVLTLPIRDTTSGYRAYRTEYLDKIDYATTRAKGYGFQIETAYRAWRIGANITEYPISFKDRVRGYSKMTWKIAAEELTLVTWWGCRDRILPRLRRRHSAPVAAAGDATSPAPSRRSCP